MRRGVIFQRPQGINFPRPLTLMKVVAFITDYRAVDRIIDHLKLTFVAEKPPPSRVFQQVALMAAEERTDYFKKAWFPGATEVYRL